jgi:hypothetical protein
MDDQQVTELLVVALAQKLGGTVRVSKADVQKAEKFGLKFTGEGVDYLIAKVVPIEEID